MRSPIYLDTNAFISAFESETPRSDQIWAVFDAIAEGEFVGVTSELTIAELLPKPLSLGQDDLVNTYIELLSGENGIVVRAVTWSILIETASLRSRLPSLRLPDAVQLATALQEDCKAFVSNDRRIPDLPNLQKIRPGPDCLIELRRMNA